MTNPIIQYWPNGNKRSEEYILNNKLHRDPAIGPAYIFYHENGNKQFEEYFVNGELHRDPEIGPADTHYDENNEIIWMAFWFNDKVHNPYGPSMIDCEYGKIFWFSNDIEYTNEVEEYLDKHGYKWQNMDHTDFDIMWTIIL